MRSSGLYSAMGLLTDLSRSWWDLTNVMGSGLLDPTDYPKSESKHLLGCRASAG